MASDQVKRKLAAILAADIAGYSRLMGADEAGTLARLKEHRRELIDPKNKQYRGRVVKTTGDGILIEFPSVVDALGCAIDVQQGMRERDAGVPPERRIEFRIGINLGDVIIDGRDLYGDGVNIAARLEGLAEPGGICISQTVLNHARGKIVFDVEDLGEQALKNIAQPIHVYRLLVASSRESTMSRSLEPALVLPDKPSIAVLPFQNMSGDPEQEYFADGIVEEIITALSHFRQLFVIARNSSFTYKGRAVDVKQVGRELGIRYVLEGSVRKAANRVRITAQLIDTSTGSHLWANRFDESLENVFDLQDQVTASVVGAISPKLEQAEIDRAKRKPTDSLGAYDYYLHGIENAYHDTRETVAEALLQFSKAIELDPNFADAYAMAAFCYVLRKQSRWMSDEASEIAEAARLARKALQLGSDNAVVLARAGHALAYVVGEINAGKLFVDRALALNPNMASAWLSRGWLSVWIGEPDMAIKHFAQFKRLSPLDRFMSLAQSGNAFAYFFGGNYEDALSQAEQTLQENPHLHPALRVAAASSALAGRDAEAEGLIARLRQIDPALRVSNLIKVTPLRRAEDITRYTEAMRKAGLPE